MYEIALSVSACLRAGTAVDVAWVVETRGFAARDLNEAVALTPGGGRVGSLLSGAVHDQLAQQAASGRLVDLHVTDLDAEAVGLACGGYARCLLVPATDLPADLWQRLRDRDPVSLVTRLDGDRVRDVTLADPEANPTGSTVTADTVVSTFRPVPKLLVVGAGAVADAVCRAAGLLGWHTEVATQASAATGVIAGLSHLDQVVVTSHDVEVAGPALAAALATGVGYIGALGSRRTQQARAHWLAYRGVTDLDRVHGPAGLDIGANTPAEIAVSILAEALAVRSGTPAASLRAKAGPIHT